MLRANELTEVGVRLSVSASSMASSDLGAAGLSTMIVTADPLSAAPSSELALRVSSIRVDQSRSRGLAKTAQYLVYLLAVPRRGRCPTLNHNGEPARPQPRTCPR
jgi:hypothetical protein